jgi:hypothetical protein
MSKLTTYSLPNVIDKSCLIGRVSSLDRLVSSPAFIFGKVPLGRMLYNFSGTKVLSMQMECF